MTHQKALYKLTEKELRQVANHLAQKFKAGEGTLTDAESLVLIQHMLERIGNVAVGKVWE